MSPRPTFSFAWKESQRAPGARKSFRRAKGGTAWFLALAVLLWSRVLAAAAPASPELTAKIDRLFA